METGRPMLEYALNHPEIKWLFKPHPSLRTVLYKILPRQEVDDYYEQWEHIGKVCYTGDYVELFFESQAMITDCDSFLIEYVFTGKPIIHLKRDGYNVGSSSPFISLFDTYYKVCNEVELGATIDYVIVKHNDPNRQLRLELMERLGLCRNDVSSAIVKEMDLIFCKNDRT
jgi:CDP-glycerol glycerophosphotransferase (TagB/SpsB family)